MKRILFTGITSIIGQEIADLFLKNNANIFTISTIIRKPFVKNHLPIKMMVDNFYIGNLEDQDFLESVLKAFNPDLIVHLAQIIYTKNIINSLNRIGSSPHLIILGTTSVFSKYQSYSKIYQDSEAFLSSNYKNFTLIRSTLIYGSYMDKNFSRLFYKLLSNKFIFLPKEVLNTKYKPLFYKDLSRLIKKIIDNSNRQLGSFTITGPKSVSLKEIINLISKYCESKPKYFFISYTLILLIISILEKINFMRLKLRIDITKVKRSLEDKVYNSDLEVLFPNTKLTTIEDGLLSQFNEIKNIKT